MGKLLAVAAAVTAWYGLMRRRRTTIAFGADPNGPVVRALL